MTKLELRISELDEQLLDIITGGKLSLFANMDILQLKPGEGMKIQDIISRRNELIRMWKEENAGN